MIINASKKTNLAYSDYQQVNQNVYGTLRQKQGAPLPLKRLTNSITPSANNLHLLQLPVPQNLKLNLVNIGVLEKEKPATLL